MNTPPSPITVAGVVCCSFSGSTWLSLMLGAHPEAFCIGDTKILDRPDQPVCAIHGPDCDFWSRFNPEDPLFESIADQTRARILVARISRSVRPWLNTPRLQPRIIHLVRDGRAVTASLMRKRSDIGPWYAARWWAKAIQRNVRLLKTFDAQDVLRIHQESLAADAENTMRRVCDFLKIDFLPSMLEPWQQTMHFLGGNPGTLHSLLRQNNPSAAPENHTDQSDYAWDLSFYDQNHPARFKDERWLAEWTFQRKLAFTWIAGRLNRRLGYPNDSPPSHADTPTKKSPCDDHR